MLHYFKFLAGTRGRWLQGVLSLVPLMLGLNWIDTMAGLIVGVVGLVLLADAVFDMCVAAPLFGLPLAGAQLRKEILRRQLHGAARSSSRNGLYR